MIKYLLVILFVFACLMPAGLEAQEHDEGFIGMMARPSNDKVMLKWFPSRYHLWQQGKQKGYNIYRQTRYKDGEWLEDAPLEKLNEEPVKPYSREKWKKVLDTTEVAHSAIFSVMPDSLSDESLSAAEAMQKIKGNQLKFALSGLAINSSNTVAEVAGMFYTDMQVDNNAKYYYEIRIAGMDTSVAYGNYFVDMTEDYTIPVPYNLDVQAKGKRVSLEWANEYTNFSFAYYNIYRSGNKNSGYKRLNEDPFVRSRSPVARDSTMIYYTDSVPEFNQTYYYKIQGVTPFEDQSDFSEVIRVKVMRRLRAIPEIEVCNLNDQGHTDISWGIDKDEKPYVQEYIVQRAYSPQLPYERINEKQHDRNNTSFTDESPMASNYYRVVAVGPAGDSAYSRSHFIQPVDSIPPDPPKGLEGKADTTGKVMLHWEPNTEKDLEGYRIYRANREAQEFYRITPGSIQDTSFVDTIDLQLGYKNIHYKIAAIDNRYNPSDFSEVLSVPRPDIYPPVAPAFTSYQATAEANILSWNNSSSNDLARQVILRRAEPQQQFTPVKTFSGDSLSKTSWQDEDIKTGKTYLYSMVAIDSVGLRSDSAAIIRMQPADNPYSYKVNDVEALVSRPNEMVKLKWKFQRKPVQRFLIYRGNEEYGFRYYQDVKGAKREFYDKNLRPDSRYRYGIIAEFEDGTRSSMSEKVEVRY